MSLNRRAFFQMTAAAGATLAAAGCGSSGDAASSVPGVAGLPDDTYFHTLAADLSAAGYGTPQILIDLDRLDNNADAIVSDIGVGRYRIVEKSLPSLDLLSHIKQRTGVDKFLVLHLPFLPALVNAFPTADILVGKVQPTLAVQQFFQSIAAAQQAAVAARVRFLVDSQARLDELIALASSLALTLQVGVEIDVGLHRSGVRSPAELAPILARFVAHPAKVRFAGLLGYDGHIPFAPVAPGLEVASVYAAYRAVAAAYQGFVDTIKSDFAMLWRDDLVLNSGGTATYPLHHGGVVNDVAAGGGMLRPASYPGYLIGALQPAVFIAAPVISHFDSVKLPFVSQTSAALLDGQQGLTISGGGWAAVFVWPAGVSLAPLVSDPENLNLVPNQSLLIAPSEPAIGPGDWIFQLPRLADAIFQFERILLVRGGRLQSSSFGAYPRRY